MSEATPVGKTKAQGWEIGVRRTFSLSPENAWALLMTQPGLGCWLGEGIKPPFKKGDKATTDEGTQIEIRGSDEGSLVRMRWQPRNWSFASTLQLRVNPAKSGATISFHHEMLQDSDQREAMRKHWSDVIDKLTTLIESK